MKKTLIKRAFALIMCLMLALPAALAETRQASVMMEGSEETVEETLFASPLGFSFWYAEERLSAYHGEMGNIEGVVVRGTDPDDHMVLSMIPAEDAEEYTEDFDESIVEESAGKRVQMDVYHVLEDGRYYFLTLVAEKGQYLRAVGEYSEESKEGSAVFLQRVLDSVSFSDGCLIRAEWGEETDDGSGIALVVLTVLGQVKDLALIRLDWEGTSVTWEMTASMGGLNEQQAVTVALEFVGDMPDNGIMYTDAAGNAHAYALDISGADGSLILWDLEEE